MSAILKLHNVTKNYGTKTNKVTALNKISLSINKGEICALVGPSGSGKTTLLQVAGLLDDFDSGEIFIDGQNASKLNDAQKTALRKEKIGFIYQFHHLLAEFTSLENVMLPLLIKGENKDEAKERAAKILTEIGLENRLDHNPSQLSGGQQQRVAIARAIVSKPKLILADEPTGNLDSKNSELVFELLQDQAKKHQISCMIVTHNLDLAKKLPKIFEINDGEI